MSLQEAYEKHKPTFTQISKEEYRKRLGAPAAIIADGNAQVVVATQDQEALSAEGMDATLITEVQETLHAYSWATSLYDTALTDANLNKEAWATDKGRAYDVRGELFKYGSFGCKKNNLPDIGAELDEIKDGVGDDDMIYDLLRCNQLFTQHPTMCEGLTKFDPTWVTEALELHNRLTKLKAEVKNPNAELQIDQLEDEARQAYTLYCNKLVELREWGQFVFEDNERADKYKSMLRRKN